MDLLERAIRIAKDKGLCIDFDMLESSARFMQASRWERWVLMLSPEWCAAYPAGIHGAELESMRFAVKANGQPDLCLMIDKNNPTQCLRGSVWQAQQWLVEQGAWERQSNGDLYCPIRQRVIGNVLLMGMTGMKGNLMASIRCSDLDDYRLCKIWAGHEAQQRGCLMYIDRQRDYA